MRVPGLRWLNPEENPWKVSVLDVRPITLTHLSTSQNPEAAKNAVSFDINDDGTSFVNAELPRSHIIKTELKYPIDNMLAPGALFFPRKMEHKWALYYHNNRIYCIRSWQRKVVVFADIEAAHQYATVKSITGMFYDKNEEADLTIKAFDYIIRTHVLELEHPAPIPQGIMVKQADEDEMNNRIAWLCFSQYGELAHFATPYSFNPEAVIKPLRTFSLLHYAAAQGNLEAAKNQILNGVPPDLIATNGFTALHTAVLFNNSEMVKCLIDNGSPVDVLSSEGVTPLMFAVELNKIAEVMLLLEKQANPNVRDNRGFTALHRAAELGHTEIVKLLLDKGGDPSIESQGHTAITLATNRKRPEIVDLLK